LLSKLLKQIFIRSISIVFVIRVFVTSWVPCTFMWRDILHRNFLMTFQDLYALCYQSFFSKFSFNVVKSFIKNWISYAKKNFCQKFLPVNLKIVCFIYKKYLRCNCQSLISKTVWQSVSLEQFLINYIKISNINKRPSLLTLKLN